MMCNEYSVDLSLLSFDSSQLSFQHLVVERELRRVNTTTPHVQHLPHSSAKVMAAKL